MLSSHTNEVKVHVRWMLRRDLPEVLAIEQDCFEYAWNEDEFLNCLRQRNCIGMVAEVDRKIVGFMIYELPKTKIHLLNIATLRGYRRFGIATQMVAKLISKLSHQRRNRITLQVRETNLDAQLFFRATGFRATEILKDFYEETCEDAYFMQYRFMQYRQNETSPQLQSSTGTAPLTTIHR